MDKSHRRVRIELSKALFALCLGVTFIENVIKVSLGESVNSGFGRYAQPFIPAQPD